MWRQFSLSALPHTPVGPGDAASGSLREARTGCPAGNDASHRGGCGAWSIISCRPLRWGSRSCGTAASCCLGHTDCHPPVSICKTQGLFSTSSVLSTTKDESTASTDSATKATSKEGAEETPKQKLLKIIGNMKVELTTKRKFQQLKEQEIKKQAANKQEGPDSESSTEDNVQRSRPLNPELVQAASAVAASFPHSKEQAESELLAQLRRHEETTDKQRRGGTINIRNVISEMAVKRESPAQRGASISRRISLEVDEDGQRIKPGRPSSRSLDSTRSLKAGKRLNIFTKASPEMENALKTVSSPTIWDLEFAKEIAAVTEQPPRNGFEEMIQWTKEGILWEFPIDNEAGMEDDAEFHEHIFLEKHLQDFPKQGPIRHFMELVICGLSKNPYLSVKQKIEHIDWFRNYFEEKKEYLQEV